MLALKELVHFFFAEWRILSFGLLFQFISSFGRTFYIALFAPEIQNDFDLTPGEFSYIYSAATLTAVLLMPWLGRMVDYIDIQKYAVLMICGLAISSLSLAGSWHVAVLYFALFGFRATGGSMMNHASAVTMSRYFERRRGIATSICALGISVGEAILPLLAVVIMGMIGWRMAWLGSGLLLILLGAPLVAWLLWPSKVDTRSRHESTTTPDNTEPPAYTRRDALKDLNFYLLAPTIILPIPMITALFFHHGTIADVNGWSLEWLAICFVAYALATIASSIFFGILVDRFSARRVLPWTTLPMIFGLLYLVYGSTPYAALLYLMGVGVTTGGRHSLSGAIWAEIYGTRHLGGIRSIVHTATAVLFGVAPAVIGWLIDSGVAVDIIVGTFVCMLLGSMVLAFRPSIRIQPSEN
jgi:MFS family permease